MTITDEQLAELKRLYENSTPGEWKTVQALGSLYIRTSHGEFVCIVPNSVAFRDVNADFIIAAHNLLPALLDRLAACEAELAERNEKGDRMSQLFRTSLPIKRSWRTADGRLFFETGEFMLLTEKGFAVVENSIWEDPNEPVKIEHVTDESTNAYQFQITKKAPRLVEVKWGYQSP